MPLRDASGWPSRFAATAGTASGSSVRTTTPATPSGSAANDEGQIFVEPQGICVMAGLGLDSDLAERALAAVRERLATPHGIVLVQPAYSRYRLELGEITTYPPGYKENAGVFCHTNPWIVIAETLLGNGDAALDYYLRTNPSAREQLSELHRCEPYVYAQMIAGRDAPTHGEAKNSWLTGTAAWNLVAITQWILGIRPEHDGLRIDPCLPAAWEGFTAERAFRGATYRITVRKQAGVQGRVSSLVVDGERQEGNVVPVHPDGSRRRRRGRDPRAGPAAFPGARRRDRRLGEVGAVELQVEAASSLAAGRNDVLRRLGEVEGIVGELFAHQLPGGRRSEPERLARPGRPTGRRSSWRAPRSPRRGDARPRVASTAIACPELDPAACPVRWIR